MVRPESIQVGDPADAPEASLRGRIVQTSFLGSQTRDRRQAATRSRRR